MVLPAAGHGRIGDRALRNWLARGDLQRERDSRTTLARVVDELGAEMPAGGLAGIRMWGQTGDRPSAWIAAADPVYLQPELDRLRLHALASGDLPGTDLKRLVDHLQAVLGSAGGAGFARIGSYCYLTADTSLPTADQPPEMLDQCIPTDYLPGGSDRARHRSLLSEIEMALHEHPVNAERERAGKPVVNSLWIWGGGLAPATQSGELPPLFADDPLLRGFWRQQQSQESGWPGSVEQCLAAADGDVVIAAPVSRPLEQSLNELRRALVSRRVDSLVLLFADDLRAALRRTHALRFWRRDDALLRAVGAQ